MSSPRLQTATAARLRRGTVAAAAVLLAGIAAICLPPRADDGGWLTWQRLLAAGNQPSVLPSGLHLTAPRRGLTNEVVADVRAADGTSGVEIHIVPRGCWSGIRESRSFGIGYETSQSPAADREAITEAIAQAVRRQDTGLPAPEVIPLDATFDLRSVEASARDRRGLLLWLSLAGAGGLALRRSRASAVAALAIGTIALLARAGGLLNAPAPCPDDAALILDPTVRALQLGWALAIASAPLLAWRAARAIGVDPPRTLLAIGAAALIAAAVLWAHGNEPLHANAHAWREAREVMLPWTGNATETSPFLHGRSAIALQWLLAAAEHGATGGVDPFRLSRLAGAAAAGATALLVAVLLRAPLAGLAAGIALGLTPLAQTLAVSGSTLAVPAALLPWTLALLVAAAASGERALLAGAALSAGLAIMSHTAMAAWPAALGIAWLLAARRDWRWSRAALFAGLAIAGAWLAEIAGVYGMVAGRNAAGGGLLAQAGTGVLHHNVLLDRAYASPALLPLALLGAASGLRRGGGPVRAVSAALLLVAAPFFAVTICSSDAVRYQSALLGLVTSLAIVGVWNMTAACLGDGVGRGALRAALLAGLVLLPLPAWRAPIEPSVLEHRLVEEAVQRMQPGTLVVLPARGREGGRVRMDFPDFLLPPQAHVAFDGDPAIAAQRGPQLRYLGLACLSWDELDGPPDPSGVRPECSALRGDAAPWLTRTLSARDIPRADGDGPWTFFRMTTGVPFGFFSPAEPDAPRPDRGDPPAEDIRNE